MTRTLRALVKRRLAGILVFLATLTLALSLACILPGQQPDDDDDASGDDDTGDDDTGDDDTGDDDTTEESPCSAGEGVHEGCGPISYDGCCEGETGLLWCENGWLCTLDCTENPSCGWEVTNEYYNCGTDGEPAPLNTPPLECP